MNDERTTALTVLLGPANSGKLGHVLAWWQSRLGERAVVVAPTGPDARALTAEMVGRVGGLVGQSPAVTFDGLVQLLLGRSPRYATELESELIVSRVLAGTPTLVLGSAVRLPGVGPALKTLLARLDESGLGPDEIDAILARWAAVDSTATLGDDIRALAAAYRRSYARLGLSDRPTAVREAMEILQGGSSVFMRPVALYGFTSFTPGQRSLIELLSRQTEVLVSLTYDDTRAVNLCTPAEIGWWRARGKVEQVPVRARAYDSPAIARLERGFMSESEPPEPQPDPGPGEGVRFMLAAGRRAEAELAAEQIATLLRSGVRPGDIAVVVRNVAPWSQLLARVFGSCSIPYYLDHRPRLMQTGLGHAFVNVVKGVFTDDAGALLAYLRSPFSGVPLDTVSDLELLYRRATAKGASALATLAAESGLTNELWRLRTSHEELDIPLARRLIRDMVAAATRGASVGGDDLENDIRAFRALDAALDTFACLALSDDRMTSSQSVDYRTALSGLGSAAAAAQREDPAAVQVLSVQRARARRFPVVFMLGLVEGEFPGRSDRPSLLTPAQRARLDEVGDGMLPDDADDEAALFLSAVSRASRMLVLSARDAEDDGSEATPSHFWTSARQVLGVTGTAPLRRTLGDQVYSNLTAPTARHYERACAAAGLMPAAYGAEGRRLRPSWHCVPGTLTDAGVLADLAGATSFSPSALEAYVRCPFAWFVQRIIKAEELEVQLDGRRLGNLLHSVLRETYQRLAAGGLLPLTTEGVQQALRIAQSEVDVVVSGTDCPGSTAERRLAGWRLCRMVANLFEMEVTAGWLLTPRELETWVGRGGGVDVGGFKINGRVDRVDTTPDRRGLFIIDYKSGTIPGASAIGGEEGLQLPLYLLAMAAERPRNAVLGGAYLGLADKKRSGLAAEGAQRFVGEAGLQGCRLLDGAALEELLQKTRDISLRAIEGMRSGIIAPGGEKSCPPWCELAPACRARKGGFRR